jgi:hypothetical protein
MMESQEQDQWCWAAVGVSIANFLESPNPPQPPGVPHQQCAVVNQALHQTTCCIDGSTNECDKDGFLDSALGILGHLRGSVVTGTIPPAEIQQEIAAGRPVGVRIGWYPNGQLGHFVALTGYDEDGGPHVHVEDPTNGPNRYAYDLFCTEYNGNTGFWTHTYAVR